TMFAAFVALLGFFLFEPRMHSRYAYAALVFLAPLALDAPQVSAMLAVLSATFLVNLVFTMRAANDFPFDRASGQLDWIAICCALANLAVFTGAVAWATRPALTPRSPRLPRPKPLQDSGPLADRRRS